MIRAALVAISAFAVFSAASAAAPARLGVSSSEFHLVLSRGSVKTGRVIVQLPVTSPGGRTTLSLRLLPGRYRLWCSLANHAQLGMRAVLRVRR